MTKLENGCKHCDGKGEYMRYHKPFPIPNGMQWGTMIKCEYCLGTGEDMPLSKVGF